MVGTPVNFFGPNGIGNEFFEQLIGNDNFVALLEKRLGTLSKADTISQATNLLWYDLSPIIQMLYPNKQLTPIISRLPRVPTDGGNAFHWKRITAINPNNVSSGVSEGNRGARIAITEQDMTASFKTQGLESAVTFEARLGARGLSPEVLGLNIQSTLRALRIEEEKNVICGNASIPLGTTPTPTLVAGAVAGQTGTFSGATYVACVALSGSGFLNYSTYSSVSGLGGIPGRITKQNADGSNDTYGGGSAAPSAIATVTPSGTQSITASATAVAGAVGYAWFVGATNSAASMYFAGITPSNQVVLTSVPASTRQPLSSLYVSGVGVDNSTNILLPDGLITQILGAVTGPDPGRAMATNSLLPTGISFSPGGSILYQMSTGNTGLTISGSTINEFDAIFRAAYDQYKLGYERILMSSTDMLDTFGAMLNQSSAANLYRILFDADEVTGRIVAGRKVTSYQNKFTNQILDVEVHPYLPPGTILFCSDRSPYEVSGLGNLWEARVRQDYYQIQWPWQSRRYEYGVYVDEIFPMYFAPGFAAIVNKNTSSGSLVY